MQVFDLKSMVAKLRSMDRLAHEIRVPGASIVMNSPLELPCFHFTLRNLLVTVRLRSISRYQYDFGHGLEISSCPFGSICVLPPNGDIFIACEEPIESISFFLNVDLLHRVAFESTDGNIPEFTARLALADPLISQIGLTLADDIAAGHPGGRFLQESLVTSMAARLIRNHDSRPIKLPPIGRGLSPAQLRSAIAYIESHLLGEASLFEIAQAVGLSPFHFARLFRKSTGTSPRQFLLRSRATRATELIRANPGRKLSWVAAMVGFHDERHLARYFVRFVGCSPAHYRRDMG